MPTTRPTAIPQHKISATADAAATTATAAAMPGITARDFINRWGPGGPSYDLTERAGPQAHFIDLCRLLGVPEPDQADRYTFEKGLSRTGGGSARTNGFADVWLKGYVALGQD